MNWLLLNSIVSASITLLFGLVFLAFYWLQKDLLPSRYWGISYLFLMLAMATTGVRIVFPELNPYFLSALLAASAALGCFYLYCGIRIWRQNPALKEKTRAIVALPMLIMCLLAAQMHALEPLILVVARCYIAAFTMLAIHALLTGSQRSNLGHYLTAIFLVGVPLSQLLSFYLILNGSWGADGIAAVSVDTLLTSPLAAINFIGLPIAFTGIGLFCLLGMLLEFSFRLYEESIRDWLTGCYNRRGFVELANKLYLQTERQGGSLSLILIDMDNFKAINDTYGHDAGDAALKLTAKLLNQRLRGGDILARWGGEEFIALLPDTSDAQAALVAEALRHKIAHHPLSLDNGEELAITASFGVTASLSTDSNLDAMISRADTALYRAKSEGKNRVAPAAFSAA